MSWGRIPRKLSCQSFRKMKFASRRKKPLELDQLRNFYDLDESNPVESTVNNF